MIKKFSLHFPERMTPGSHSVNHVIFVLVSVLGADLLIYPCVITSLCKGTVFVSHVEIHFTFQGCAISQCLFLLSTRNRQNLVTGCQCYLVLEIIPVTVTQQQFTMGLLHVKPVSTLDGSEYWS